MVKVAVVLMQSLNIKLKHDITESHWLVVLLLLPPEPMLGNGKAFCLHVENIKL